MESVLLEHTPNEWFRAARSYRQCFHDIPDHSIVYNKTVQMSIKLPLSLLDTDPIRSNVLLPLRHINRTVWSEQTRYKSKHSTETLPGHIAARSVAECSTSQFPESSDGRWAQRESLNSPDRRKSIDPSTGARSVVSVPSPWIATPVDSPTDPPIGFGIGRGRSLEAANWLGRTSSSRLSLRTTNRGIYSARSLSTIGFYRATIERASFEYPSIPSWALRDGVRGSGDSFPLICPKMSVSLLVYFDDLRPLPVLASSFRI